MYECNGTDVSRAWIFISMIIHLYIWVYIIYLWICKMQFYIRKCLSFTYSPVINTMLQMSANHLPLWLIQHNELRIIYFNSAYHSALMLIIWLYILLYCIGTLLLSLITIQNYCLNIKFMWYLVFINWDFCCETSLIAR